MSGSMQKIKIHLRDGSKVEFRAVETFVRIDRMGLLKSLRAEGSIGFPLYLNLNDVSAVTYEDEP